MAAMSEDEETFAPLRTIIAVIAFVVGIAVGVLIAACRRDDEPSAHKSV
jgi:hypothetical protein